MIAKTNPDLYRRMHIFAWDHFQEALKYYHVTPDLHAIKPLDRQADDELSEYMNDDNARQLLHVTYGLLLTATDDNGKYLFRDEFFKTLRNNEEVYNSALKKHIGRHLDTLGL